MGKTVEDIQRNKGWSGGKMEMRERMKEGGHNKQDAPEKHIN